jgi:hypothetical protein
MHSQSGGWKLNKLCHPEFISGSLSRDAETSSA